MKRTEHTCNSQRLQHYYDGELSGAQRRAVADHLTRCEDCRAVLHQQQQLARNVQRAAAAAAGQPPRPDVEGRLLTRITRAGQHGKARPSRRSLGRWIPAGAFVLLLGFMAINRPWQEPVRTAEPSAIVESFHGNVSTVMILETQTTGQTIVWFNELSEPNGESNGNQSAPPAMDRSAFPAVDQQRRLGRA